MAERVERRERLHHEDDKIDRVGQWYGMLRLLVAVFPEQVERLGAVKASLADRRQRAVLSA